MNEFFGLLSVTFFEFCLVLYLSGWWRDIESRWQIFLAFLAFIVLWCVNAYVSGCYLDRKRGYSVHNEGEHSHRVIYKDREKGSLELHNNACMDKKGKYYFVIEIPSEAEWQKKMPEWAKEDREKIVGRIMTHFGSKDFYYGGYGNEEARILKERPT